MEKDLNEEFRKLHEILNDDMSKKYGKILIPTCKGIDVYTLPVERLELYLKQEVMYNNLKHLYDKKNEFFKKSDDEIIEILQKDFGNILEDII